jgi:uncharacterized protein with von Willebrand factor type A (vWA) domain
VPDPPGHAEAHLERLVSFGRALRDEGVAAGTGRIGSFCHAASLLAPADLYWAGRVTLVASEEEITVYDRVFRAFFGGEEQRREQRPLRVRAGRAEPAGWGGEGDGDEPGGGRASTLELLRRKSFARCSPAELAQLAVVMGELRLALPPRRTRRRQAARSGSPDLRRTLRRSFRTGGEPLERAWRERRRVRRRLVLILDVSGSMTDYSRALLLFAHAALRADRRREAFCFGTRLTRVTAALACSDPDDALARAAEEVVDWDAGTRIGESLQAFLDRFGHAGIARGAVVVICSDGLEVGDPELLGEQMARLSRLAHRVVWLNPLSADPAYEPLARGMEASLPHVDVFASGHDLASLEAVVEQLERM